MRFPIRTKIMLACVVILLAVAGFIALLLNSEEELAESMRSMIRVNLAGMRAAEQIKHSVVLYDGLIFRYLATNDELLLVESARARKETLDRIQQMKSLTQSQDEQDMLTDLDLETERFERDAQALIETYRTKTPAGKQSILERLRGVQPPEDQQRQQAIALLSAEGRARLMRIYALCEKLVTISRTKLEESQRRVEETVLRTQWTAIRWGGAVVLVIMISAILLFLSISQPLNSLLGGVTRVSGGDLNLEIPVQSADEIGKLTQAFNAMTRNLKEQQKRLAEEAIRDPLTGLYNFRYAQTYLKNELARSTRYQRPFSLLIVDIDNFKQYNDANGHPMGDAVLKQVAELLQESLREEGTVARYGGEEFFVGLPEADAEAGKVAAERIRSAVANASFPGAEKQPQGKLTISVGGASFPKNAGVVQQLVQKADEALYAAKNAGRDRVHWIA